MITAQERILGAIENELLQLGYECAIQKVYGNVGTVYIYLPRVSTTSVNTIAVASINFDFQDGTYKLSLTVSGKKIPSQPGRADYFEFYQRYDQHSAFWSALEMNLPKLPTERQAA